MTDTATISAEVISEYVLLGRRIEEMEAQRRVIRDDLMVKIKGGAVISPTSPWEVYVKCETRTSVDWKTLALDLLERVHGAGWRSVLNGIERAARVEAWVLRSRANPRYGLIAREWPSDSAGVSTENGD